MKVFTVPAYNPEEKDDLERPAVQARAWYIAFAALSQAPSGPTAERSHQVNRIYGALKSGLQTTGDKERRLNPNGVEFVLEDAEIKVFKEILDGFRNNVTGAGSDALVFIDHLIANAPEQPKIRA